MKTLYVITKSNWGGAQKYVYDQAAMRIKYPDAKVAVLAGGNGELCDRLEKIGVPVYHIPNLERDIDIFKEFSVFIALLKTYRSTKPNTIHLNSSKIGGIGALAGRVHNLFSKQKAKIIFTAHGWAFNEDRNPISKFIIKVISYTTILMCHEVIVLSAFERDQASRWRGCSKKIRVEKLRIAPIDFSVKSDAQNVLIDKLPALREHINKKWVGTIAELHKNKGLEFGIEAIKNIRDQNFIWVIIGEGEARTIIQREILRHNLQNKIFLVGYVSDASKLLKAFDIFLLPSIKEGLPYVLLEAEQAKLPIIATEVGGIPEYFNKAPNIIVPPKDSQYLSNAILKMI